MRTLKAATYARPCQILPRIEVRGEKWGQFWQMIQESEGKADVVIVAFPEVLGDNYEELVANLSAIASHGLHLAIVPPEDAGFTVIKRLPGT